MNTSAKPGNDPKLEIGHVLFMDVVGYSKLLNNEQREIQRQLTEIVRGTKCFQAAEGAGKLIRLPVGDGMALVFFDSPEAPVQCAAEISRALKAHPKLSLRMGIHSGPVSGLTDVNDQSNVAGAGINTAQRVMDCGDAGHILLSKRVAEDLGQEARWRSDLHDLGECVVKHGIPVSVVNFCTSEIGNPEVPEKVKASRQQQARGTYRQRTVLVGGAILLGAMIATYLYLRPAASRFPPAGPPDKSIAVLPLTNLTDEKENAYFADGVQDELLSNLAKIKDLKVISRTSVMQYKAGITRNLKEIAQELGVTNVVEGSVRRSGNHIRVTVQLIDALTDRHIWSQNYDRTLADSLALQGELATEIAAGVGATLSPQEKAWVEATPTRNTAAYDAYIRGRAAAGRLTEGQANYLNAIEFYQEAVRLDPGFALAWAYLSYAQSAAYWSDADATSARLAGAKEALDHVMALEPELPEAHLALGYYRYYGARDFKGALAEFQEAQRSLPNDAEVLKAIGLIQRRFGHWDDAIAALKRVVELDPRNTDSASILALTYMASRHFTDALGAADRILGINPSSPTAITIKVYCFWALGDEESADLLLADPAAPLHVRAHQAIIKRRFPEAVEILSKVLNNQPDSNERHDLLLDVGFAQKRAGNVTASKAAYQQVVHDISEALGKLPRDSGPAAEMHSALGVAYAGLGDATLAVSEGQKGMALQPSPEDPFEGPLREEQLAQIYALLGNADQAIPILERLSNVHSTTEIVPAMLRVDPIWDSIRNDPRFRKLSEQKSNTVP